jgi:hypothetical protein
MEKVKNKRDNGTKTVILILIEKQYTDAELGTFSLEEYVNNIHPWLIIPNHNTSL